MLKRRLLISFLILINAVFFQGCCKTVETISEEQFNKVEVLEMYNEAAEKIESFSTVKVKMNTDFFINDGINSLQLNMITDIKQINEEDGIELEMNSSTNYMDKNFESVSYYKDGFFYTDYDSKKIKYNINEEEIKNDSNVFLTKIEPEQVKDYSVEKNKDGSMGITITADPEVVENLLKKYIIEFMNADEKSVEVSKFRISILVDTKKVIKSCDTLISMKNHSDEGDMECTVDSYMDYSEINGDLDIEFPDFKEYHEEGTVN